MADIDLPPMTAEELAALPLKATKHPKVVQLFATLPFTRAYAAHTDMRVSEDPRGAVGNHLDWDFHGGLQLAFLKQQGLQPEHDFLEIGCGTGRLARHVVPYLVPARYVGVDISKYAITHAWALAEQEHWLERVPKFVVGDTRGLAPVDVAWAYSVMIHLPYPVMLATMQRVAELLKPGGRFYWSYVPEQDERRTGLKQFRHKLETYQRAAAEAGLTFEEVPNWVELAGFEPSRATGNQRMALSRVA